MRRPLFEQVRIKAPKYNAFDLGHEKKLSFNMGELIPILLQEVVPGDKFRVNSELFMRMAPMVAPIMHRVNVYTHYFFVPNRLVYEDWEDFITGGELGTANPSFPVIQIQNANKSFFAKGTLADYLGIPVTGPGVVANPLNISALPFRAYQLIYNEYYRDQNLQTAIPVTKNGTVDWGGEGSLITLLRNRAWEKDYFTSCLPWAQKGAEITIPNTINYLAASTIKRDDGLGMNAGAVSVDNENPQHLENALNENIRVENIEDLEIAVNDLRRSMRLQEWLEKNARVGSRYVESILAHFGIRTRDHRLQRPEYLGGGKSPVTISEVLNTSDTATAPQGNMSGHGISVGTSHRFKRAFDEHGYIIGIMSVLPRTAYQQGVHRTWTKFDKFDYFWPELAHIGEQAVLNRELFMDYEGAGVPAGTFGYQARYSEYKYGESTVHGEMKDTLDFWHMGRKFTGQPSLNSTFIISNPTHRIFADTNADNDKLFCQLYNDVKAIRPMPVFGTPML